MLHLKWTNDEGLYIYEWELIGNKVAAFLGGQLVSFDPGFNIAMPYDNHLTDVAIEKISLGTALKIMKMLEDNKA